MAQYNASGLIGEIKGSIGSTTFQGGNHSTMIRVKKYHTQKQSDYRNLAKSNLAAVATAWRGLTDGQRATWVSTAAHWPLVNKFGVTFYPTPFECFCAYNIGNIKNFVGIKQTPNAITAPIDIGPYTSLAIDSSSMLLSWTTAPSTHTWLSMFASPCLSPGRNGKAEKTQYIGVIDISGLTSYDMIGEYTERFGAPIVNQKIFLRTYYSDVDYPYPYFPNEFSAIVT